MEMISAKEIDDIRCYFFICTPTSMVSFIRAEMIRPKVISVTKVTQYAISSYYNSDSSCDALININSQNSNARLEYHFRLIIIRQEMLYT